MADIAMTVALAKALGKPSDEQVTSAVDDWLDDHPEATTTVQDGSITKAKLDSNLQGTVDDVDELKSAIDAIADVEYPIKIIDASTLTWGVSEAGNAVVTTPVQIKAGSKLKFERTTEATGKLYNPVTLYYTVNGVYTYKNFLTGTTETFADDCEFYIIGGRVSTSDIPYADLAVLAKDCFSGDLKTEDEIQIVTDIKELQSEAAQVDAKISEAIAPALGGDVSITPTWTSGYYYNSSLQPTSYTGFNCAKVDISNYINAKMTMLAYAGGVSRCGFTDADDSIIETWGQTSQVVKTIPINAKYLYISNAPGNLSPSVFSCVITLKNSSIGVAYLDVATGLKEYDSNLPYVVGNLCTKDGTLMHCISDTTGTYDPDDWQETTIVDEFGLRDYIHPVTKLNGLSWKACGDSITAGSNGPTYVNLMASLLGITEYTNSGVGGAYLATCYNGQAVTDDIITLLGGTNDFGLSSGAQTLEAFETGVRGIITNFRTNNATARLYMITPIPRFDKTENEYEATLLDYVEVIEQVCSEMNIPCLNLYERCGINASNYQIYLKSDGVHPNEYGAARIAVEIAKFVSDMEAVYRMTKMH